MAPPPPPARKVVVDQYGNKYYAAEPQQPSVRASVAPQPRLQENSVYERAPSRASVAYAPRPGAVYEDVEPSSMAPPPRRIVARQEYAPAPTGYRDYRPVEQARPGEPVYYSDESRMPPPSAQRIVSRAGTVQPGGYPAQPQRQYSARPPAPEYYPEVQGPVYGHDVPPPPPQRAQTVYAQDPSSAGQYVTRAYSVRPEQEPAVRYVSRHPSMAPQAEYIHRQEPPGPPMRAVSVMPAPEYDPRQSEVRYSYAPAGQQHNVRYVNENGMY